MAKIQNEGAPPSLLFRRLYDLALLITALLFTPVLIFRLIKGKYRRSLFRRLSHDPGLGAFSASAWESGKAPFLVHGVSVGEISALSPLVAELKKRHPESEVIVTTVTETGNEMALRRCPQARVTYLPFDFGPLVGSFLDTLRPGAIIVAETELWPSLYWEAALRSIPLITVNGRISDKAWSRYEGLRWFFRRVLTCGALFLVQDTQARDRFITLGARPERVIPAGNLKFDSLPSPSTWKSLPEIRGLMKGLEDRSKTGPIIALASTHPGEEVPLAKALLEKLPTCTLFVIPRHVERSVGLSAQLSGETRRSCVLRSLSGPEKGGIWILDTIGEMTDLFQYVDLVIMGGSFVPVGGHNVLEPAAWGKPVIWGPHMENFREAEALLRGAGGFAASDPAQAAQVAMKLLENPSEVQGLGRAAMERVNSLRGATDRALSGVDWAMERQ